MLSKHMRKKFLEHDLLYILDHDSNKYQQWQRVRDDCLDALRDLALVACKTPDDKLHNMFNEKNIIELIRSILFLYHSDKGITARSPDVKMASSLVNLGVTICMTEYQRWNKDLPESIKPTIDYLEKCIGICSEIGYKSRLNVIENEGAAKKLNFICIWEDISGKDQNKINRYILNELKSDKPIVNSNLPLVYDVRMSVINRYEKEFRIFEFDIASAPEDGILIGKVRISISLAINKAKLIFYNRNDQEIKNKSLVIKKYDDSQTALFE